jgi:NAD(P)H-dependent flavin oxidoreductase YrpB (nitropropane dioxygenase family)
MKSILHSRESGEFGFIFSNVAGLLDGGIAIAASRSGATGILNCESVKDVPIIRKAIERVSHYARGSFGIKLEIDSPVTIDLLTDLPDLDCIVLVASGSSADDFEEVVTLARAKSKRLLIEVTSENAARSAVAWPVDGLIAKGHEAGGAVGEETTFILLQRLLREFTLPIWAHGGIGLHSSAACYVAGAAGVVLDSQLLLLAESSLLPRVRTEVERIEGDETVTLGRELGSLFRLYRRPGLVSIDGLQELERELSVKPVAEGAREWRTALGKRINWENAEAFMWPLGQDSAFAAPLAGRFGNVSALLTGLREAIAGHVAAARQYSPLGSGSALARAHGTEFPVLQGPMTRVSDAAGFADAVLRFASCLPRQTALWVTVPGASVSSGSFLPICVQSNWKSRANFVLLSPSLPAAVPTRPPVSSAKERPAICMFPLPRCSSFSLRMVLAGSSSRDANAAVISDRAPVSCFGKA